MSRQPQHRSTPVGDDAVFRIDEERRNIWACGLLAAAGLAAYANSFQAPFVFDGLPLQAGLRDLTWNAAGWLAARPRTVAYLTFDLQHTLHGDWLFGFHAVNVAIHITAAIALFAAVLATCRGPGQPFPIRRDATGIALATALLFELHPLQTQAVTYLYQRFESLMGMFFLLAVFCFAMAVRDNAGPACRRNPWLPAAWAAVILSIGSKEVGAAAPLVLLWYDRVFAAESWRELWERRGWFHLSLVAVLAAGLSFMWSYRDHYAAGGIFDSERMSSLTYALTQPEVICRYLRLAFWPHGLCLDWDWRAADTVGRIVPPLIVLLAMLGFTCWAAVRLPPIGFLLGSFFLILAPTSSFAPIVDLAFEHRMYLPLAPLAALTVLIGRAAVGAAARRLAIEPRTAQIAAMIALGGVATALGTTTFLRNEVYRSGSKVWGDVLQKVPENARAYASLAWHIERETGDVETAIALNRRALRLNPRIAKAHKELAILLHPADRAAAIYHARAAVRLEQTADNLNNLGSVLAETAPDEAERCFREALARDDRHIDARRNLARLLELRAGSDGSLYVRPTPRPAAGRAAPPGTEAP